MSDARALSDTISSFEHTTLNKQDQTCGLYYKQVTIIIYDHNDSGQYYKTTITIVIDDPSLS